MELIEQLKLAISSEWGIDVEPKLERPEERFGDFSSNVAMQLASKLQKSPRQIAEVLAEKLGNLEGIKEVSIAGPGFINFRLTDQKLTHYIDASLPKALKDRVIIAEYSDPNPFKSMHAGHLYTTIVGDVIANIMESAGAEIKRVNFGGDVGLHVAKAMWGILNALDGENTVKLEQIADTHRPEWISEQYVKGNSAYENDEVSKAEIIELNKKIYKIHEINDHDSEFAKIYWTCRQWSYDGFMSLYKSLAVHDFDRFYPESETTPKGLEIVRLGLDRQVFERSEGAVVYKGEKDGLHTRVFLTSDGLPTYETKDLGLVAAKWEDYKYDLSFIITGNDIVEYMKVVKKVSEYFYPEIAERSKHLTHGMILLPGGKKMSSRKGNVLMANDILESATEAYKKETGQDNYDAVLAAVKYSFLKQRLGGDVIYDPDESVNILGNSGPYLQYAYARARSILSKANSLNDHEDANYEPGERHLALKLSKFQDAFTATIDDLMPHHLANYLYELAQEFNSFYENNRVIGDKRQKVRLWLVNKYADTLKKGLNLLGIVAPERM